MNYEIILFGLSILGYFFILLYKYSLEIASIIIDPKDLNRRIFFHRKIIEFKEDSKSFYSTFYILNLIFIILPTYFSYNIHSLNIIFVFIVLYILHIIAYLIAIKFPLPILSFSYYFFTTFKVLFYPVIGLFSWLEKVLLLPLRVTEKYVFLSSEEREKIIEKIDKEGSLSNEEELEKKDIEMINSIIELKETLVKEIMIPRINLHAISFNMSIDDIIDFIIKYRHSRIPVYKDNLDNIVGILYVKDLIKLFKNKSENWQNLIREPYFVPFSKKVNDLLAEFKAKKLHIAIVVDEFGGTSGLVTMEDILEEIVGDIEDEFDSDLEKDIIKIDENTYIVDGHTSIYDIEEKTDIRFDLAEDKPYDSLSGFIQDITEKIPDVGDFVIKNGYKFIILKKNGPKIEKVKIIKLNEGE